MKLSIIIAAIFSLAINSNEAFSQETDTTLIVNGVCGMCEEKIEKAALNEGAEKADWDVESHVLTLSFDSEKTSLESISEAINKVGYDTEFESAGEEAYNGLHPCCKYRDPEVINDHK